MTSILSPRAQELWRTLIERSATLASDNGQLTPPASKEPKLPRAQFLSRALDISNRCAERPLLDTRAPEQILDFNSFGAFD